LCNEKISVPVYMSKKTDSHLSKDKFPFLERRIVSDNFKFDSIPAQMISENGLIIKTDEGKIGYFPSPINKTLENLALYIGDGSSFTNSVIKQMSLCQEIK